jgi:hypothetical protein
MLKISSSALGLVMALGIPTLGVAGTSEAIRVESEKFVVSLDGCAFIDGYRCANFNEDEFLSADSQAKAVSGNLLKAWQVALANFQSQPDQSVDQTNLKHFKVGFTENANHYIVLFQGLLMPLVEGGQAVGMTRITFGRTTKYWLNKRTLEIEKRLFYK